MFENIDNYFYPYTVVGNIIFGVHGLILPQSRISIAVLDIDSETLAEYSFPTNIPITNELGPYTYFGC